MEIMERNVGLVVERNVGLVVERVVGLVAGVVREERLVQVGVLHQLLLELLVLNTVHDGGWGLTG